MGHEEEHPNGKFTYCLMTTPRAQGSWHSSSCVGASRRWARIFIAITVRMRVSHRYGRGLYGPLRNTGRGSFVAGKRQPRHGACVDTNRIQLRTHSLWQENTEYTTLPPGQSLATQLVFKQTHARYHQASGGFQRHLALEQQVLIE